MWFIGVDVEQETSAPTPKKNPGSAPCKIEQISNPMSTGLIMYYMLWASFVCLTYSCSSLSYNYSRTTTKVTFLQWSLKVAVVERFNCKAN